MKKTVSVIMILLMMFSVSSCGASEIADDPIEISRSAESVFAEYLPTVNGQPGEISVVVLGDSIARGYGLKNVETQRFSTLLADELKRNYATVKMANYGVDGITGSELIQRLDREMPREIAESDYVLISIGGNNILRHLTELDGLRELAAGLDPQVFIDYFRFITAKDEGERKALDYARETLNMLFKSANNALAGKQFDQLVNTAADNLRKELPQIVSRIRSADPDVEIIIQTIYNPYDGMTLSLPSIDEKLDLSAYGENAVKPLNEAIESLSAEEGYTVAPVHSGFRASSNSLTNAGFDIFNAVFGIDPHPNPKGHALIAEIYYNLITEENNG